MGACAEREKNPKSQEPNEPDHENPDQFLEEFRFSYTKKDNFMVVAERSQIFNPAGNASAKGNSDFFSTEIKKNPEYAMNNTVDDVIIFPDIELSTKQTLEEETEIQELNKEANGKIDSSSNKLSTINSEPAPSISSQKRKIKDSSSNKLSTLNSEPTPSISSAKLKLKESHIKNPSVEITFNKPVFNETKFHRVLRKKDMKVPKVPSSAELTVNDKSKYFSISNEGALSFIPEKKSKTSQLSGIEALWDASETSEIERAESVYSQFITAQTLKNQSALLLDKFDEGSENLSTLSSLCGMRRPVRHSCLTEKAVYRKMSESPEFNRSLSLNYNSPSIRFADPYEIIRKTEKKFRELKEAKRIENIKQKLSVRLSL